MNSTVDEQYIPLPIQACVEVHSAAQTLGAIQYLTNGSTFVAQERIADTLELSRKTINRQIEKLHQAEWIINGGRAVLAPGKYRRTCTLKLTSKSRKAKQRKYLELPLAFMPFSNSWSHRVVFAAVFTRCQMIERIMDQGGAAEKIEEYSREAYSLSDLVRDTGLGRNTVVDAKNWLLERDLVLAKSTRYIHGFNHLADQIYVADWFRRCASRGVVQFCHR